MSCGVTSLAVVLRPPVPSFTEGRVEQQLFACTLKLICYHDGYYRVRSCSSLPIYPHPTAALSGSDLSRPRCAQMVLQKNLF